MQVKAARAGTSRRHTQGLGSLRGTLGNTTPLMPPILAADKSDVFAMTPFQVGPGICLLCCAAAQWLSRATPMDRLAQWDA